jgi:hypothetical protein
VAYADVVRAALFAEYEYESQLEEVTPRHVL